MSPCPTFFNTYDPWKDGSVPLPDWDTSDRVGAIKLAMEEDKFHLGVFYEDHRPSYDELYGAVIQRARGEKEATVQSLVDRFM
jgi:2-oxoglutarate ferredoxin oxidoreductase subunit beta